MLTPTATIVTDLGFGDAGKGTVIDYLARQRPVSAVVRYNGGAQAAHNVHTPDGRHHTFAQFGSGTFVPGVRTHLSRFVLIDPPALLREAEHLSALGEGNALARLSIDSTATVVTPFHKAANRFREVLRGSGSHGSVGMGVGETMADRTAFPHQAVLAADLRDPETLARKFAFFQALKSDEFAPRLRELTNDADLAAEARLFTASDVPEKLALAYWRFGMRTRLVPGDYLRSLAAAGDLLFEGAQGVLIDEWHGLHPYTTWSTTTPDNAMTLLSEIGYAGRVERLGVLRSYFVRHGPGPFPTEDVVMTALLPDPHNTFGRWQGGFRVGHFDAVLARYALQAVGPVEGLALTNLDRLMALPQVRVATSYTVSDLTAAERAAVVVASEAGRVATVTSFRRKPFLTDLGYQEVLTGIARRAVPHYVEAPRGEALVSFLERQLGVSVVLMSHGPTVAQKRVREPQRMAA